MLASNYFSILDYCSEVWHLHSKVILYKQLLSVSAKELRVAHCFADPHKMANKATPMAVCSVYKKVTSTKSSTSIYSVYFLAKTVLKKKIMPIM